MIFSGLTAFLALPKILAGYLITPFGFYLVVHSGQTTKGDTMSLKDIITEKQYAELLENSSPQNIGEDHYPVVWLITSGDPKDWWLITHFHAENSSLAYCLYCDSYGDGECDYFNIEQLIKDNPNIKSLAFDSLEPLSVYKYAAEIEGYITLDDRHLDIAAAYIR